METDFEHILETSPEEVVVNDPTYSTKLPCDLDISAQFSLQDGSSYSVLYFGLDIFSRRSLQEQLRAQYSNLLNDLQSKISQVWTTTLVNQLIRISDDLENPKIMFSKSMRFVERKEFKTVRFDEILKLSPSSVDVYLSKDKGSYTDFFYLRLHSSLKKLANHNLWYQRILPQHLHSEDIISWFLSSIERLPKSKQPTNKKVWVERLLEWHPRFAVPEKIVINGNKAPKKTIIVFGSESRIGNGKLFHLNREDIKIMRKTNVLTINAPEFYGGVNETGRIDWHFEINAYSEETAIRLESSMLLSEKIHFGIGKQIKAMFARSEEVLHTINVTESQFLDYCKKYNLAPKLMTNPNHQHKIFNCR